MEMAGIMALAAHPDDEGAMLATLAKYSAISREVTIVWATRGERWASPLGTFSPLLSWFFLARKNPQVKEKLHDIIGKIRTKEINRVLALLNVKGVILDFKDGSIPGPLIKPALKRIIELFRSSKPKVVITHHYGEGHPDHKNLSRLVYQAFQLSGKNYVKTHSAPYQPQILAWWDERGKGFRPNCYINVNGNISIFKAWKKIYRSQSTRIVGQVPVIKARLRAFGTPFRLVECFQIVNLPLKGKYYGEFFPCR